MSPSLPLCRNLRSSSLSSSFFLTCPKIVLMFVLWFAKQNDGGQVHDQVHFHQEFSVLKAQIVVVIVQSQLCSVLGLPQTALWQIPLKSIQLFKALNIGFLRNTIFESGKKLHYSNRVLSIWITRIPSLTLYCFETLCW